MYSNLFFAQSPSCSLSGDVLVCEGELSEYHIEVENAGSYGVQWNFPNGVRMGYDNEMAMVHWETPGTVTAVASIYASGTSTLLTTCSINIEIEDLPSPQIAPEYLPNARCSTGKPEISLVQGYCQGSEVRFFPAGATGDSYAWTLNGVPISSVDPDGSVLVVMEETGAFELCLEETSPAGCKTRVCKTYSVYALPEVGISELSHGADTLLHICKNEDLLFTGAYDHPDDFIVGSWYWTVTEQGDNTVLANGYQSAFNYTFSVAGTYVVHLYATNCLGCASPPKTVTVVVSDDIRPEIICPSIVCQSDSLITYCTTASCTDYSWTASGGTIHGSSSGPCVQVRWNMPLPDGYGWVTLKLDNCSGDVCTEPATVEVPVIPSMQPISGPANVCDPGSLLTYSVPFWPGAIYTWSRIPEPGYSGSVGNPIANTPANSSSINLSNFSGSFRVKVRIQHPVTLCDVTSELLVIVRNFEMKGPNSICYGEDLNQHVEPTPTPLPYSIHWELVGTGFSTIVDDDPNVVIPGDAFPGSGTYVLKATITFDGEEPFACDALSRLISVKEIPRPVVDISGPRNICAGETYFYSADPANPDTLCWSITGGTLLDSMGATVRVIWYGDQPEYSLTVIRKTNGCSSAPFTVDDIQEIQVPGIEILGPETVCEDATVEYMADIDGASYYNWYINTDAASILSGQGTRQIIVQWHQGSPVAMIQLNATVCSTPVADTLTVSINSNFLILPCPITSLEDCRSCANEELLFVAYSGNSSGAVFDWIVDGNQLVTDSPDPTFPYTFTQAGTHYVRVRMTGGVTCPGTFEAVLAVDVVPNPEPILTFDRTVDCDEVEPVQIFSTTYQGADSETFTWSWDGGTLSPPVYTVSGPQLTIDGATWDDYEGEFSVQTTRVIDGLTCYADSKIILECQDGFIIPDSLPDIEFTSWEFDLGQPCTTCRSATPNACGYVTVHGDLLGEPFGNVESADWRVFDYNNGLNPDDIFPADGDASQIVATPISVFSKAGYYPTTLRVKFFSVSSNLYDQRTIKIPIQPGFSWSLNCSDEPGMYDVLLRDISERVPGVGITGRDWGIEVLGGATTTVSNETNVTLLKTLPAGSLVKVCITPYADGNGVDMIDQHYFCTHCDTILIPAAPTVQITADRTTVCSGTAVHFGVEGTGIEEIISYHWDFGDFTSSSLPNPVKVFFSTPAFPVILTVTTSTGCVVSDTIEIMVQGVGGLDGDIQGMGDPCGSSSALMFHSTGSNDPVSYLWNTGDTTYVLFTMHSGLYSVTVTDAIGCTISDDIEIFLDTPFSSTLPDLELCEGAGGTITFSGNSNFTYEWTTDIPDVKIEMDATSIEVPSSTPWGVYHVTIQASISNRPCMSISATVTIHQAPSIPSIEVDYTCEPFTAHVSTNPVQMLEWTDPFRLYLGYLSEFYTGVPGVYEATASNIYGCNVTIPNIEILGPPNADILSGCYKLCDTLLKQDTICLQPPPGSFDRWSWTLDGTSILGGSGIAQPLCLTNDMNGKILFSVVKHYDNVNFEDVDCEAVSDTFCLEVLECSEVDNCPSTTFQNHLSSFQCVLGGDDFDEQVAMLSDIDIPYPPGYTYCTIPPVIKITSGGYFTNLVTQVYASKIKIVSGYLHITDPVAYGNGLPGYVLLCDEVTHDTCPVTFQLDGDRCNEPIWCMLMPSQPTVSTYWVGSVQTTSATFSIPLHFVTGPECDLSSDTIRLYSYPDYDLLAQTICSATPNPSVDAMCTISFAMATEKFNNLDCVHFEIQSNCKLNCSIDYCFSALPRPAQSRGMNVEEYFSSLDLVPNPASNMLSIKYVMTEGQQGNTGIEICNVLGQTIFRRYDSAAQGNLQIDVSEWRAGLYFVNLVAGNKKVAVKKLVKE